MSLTWATLVGLMIPGTIYMLGLAMASATTLAIAMEQAKPERRGRAMATFSIALPLSNGLGALLCGTLVHGLDSFRCMSQLPPSPSSVYWQPSDNARI